MKHSLPSLDSLKVFEAAARHLSFSLAADELCITKGAISYQIQKLETEIQCVLFKRSVRQVYLTDAGQMLFHTTKTLFQTLNHTLDELHTNKQQASVTIAATTYVASRWLSSRISRFNEAYPAINIMFQHSINTAEFKLDDVDLAIVWGIREDADKNKFNAHRFAEIPMSLFPVISPQLLQAHHLNSTKPLDINAISQQPMQNIPLLCEDRQEDMWQDWFDANKAPDNKHKLNNPRRIISDANVRVQATVDGQGLMLADEMMLNELNNDLLITPFEASTMNYSYAFYASSNRVYSDNALILKDWISKNI